MSKIYTKENIVGQSRAVSPTDSERAKLRVERRMRARIKRSANRRRVQSLRVRYRNLPLLNPMPVGEHKGSLKVLFVSGSDYAFMGYILADCLNSIGIKAVAASGRYSPLKPNSKQGHVYSEDALLNLVREAYVIVWMHSLFREFPYEVLKGKKCVVFHGGTRYRQGSQFLNRLINPRVHLSLVQTGELLDRGAKNEHWFLPPVDTVGIKPNYNFNGDGRLVIGHFSSHPNKRYIKGTDLIESTMKLLEQSEWGKHFIFRKTDRKRPVPWEENIKRMADCDIYIESLSQVQLRNKNRHDWSMQALEACALGCITITNFLFEKRYKKDYGAHGLLVANADGDLKKILVSLFQKSREELLNLKHEARQWVETQHSYEVVGERLKGILGL